MAESEEGKRMSDVAARLQEKYNRSRLDVCLDALKQIVLNISGKHVEFTKLNDEVVEASDSKSRFFIVEDERYQMFGEIPFPSSWMRLDAHWVVIFGRDAIGIHNIRKVIESVAGGGWRIDENGIAWKPSIVFFETIGGAVYQRSPLQPLDVKW